MSVHASCEGRTVFLPVGSRNVRCRVVRSSSSARKHFFVRQQRDCTSWRKQVRVHYEFLHECSVLATEHSKAGRERQDLLFFCSATIHELARLGRGNSSRKSPHSSSEVLAEAHKTDTAEDALSTVLGSSHLQTSSTALNQPDITTVAVSR